MTLPINQIYKQYKDSAVSFLLVFPSSTDTPKKIKRFLKTYHIEIPYTSDPNLNLVKTYNATVTPQCFVMSSDSSIIYSGKIDNWFYEVGKYRQVTTEYYLLDAIIAARTNKKPQITKTEPVGCFINKY